MTKYIGLLLGFICLFVLVPTLIGIWVENQHDKMNYERCLEVVTMYKNYVERN